MAHPTGKRGSYKQIVARGVCPYCYGDIKKVGAWGALGCPNKICDFWKYHKQDWRAMETQTIIKHAIERV
jgi:hypothetical protein